MASFQYGGLVEQVAVTATAAGTTTLTSTSKQIQVFTGSSSQIIVLPAATTMAVGQKFEIYNESSTPLTLQFNGGASFTDAASQPYGTISPHTSIVAKLQTNGTSAGTWAVQAGGSASGSGGSKNYLAAYTASTSSSVANTGNGNFEAGSTTGWSLAHSTLTSLLPTSVATAGSAFSASSGGSAASGNLSFSVVTAGLSGSYTGSLVSSAASTAGDMLISSAFFIDTEDQAKMMQVKFYYQQNTGSGNFSGTSSNSYAVWIYDVTNGAWIMPQGVYNLVQNSKAGYCTATFQTTSNSTQYQLALININSTAAYTLLVDDFSVGPQTAPTGPAMSDWVSYTPTITGFGTATSITASSRRVGDSLETYVKFTSGVTTATAAQISLGYGGANANVTVDTTKVAGGNIIGSAVCSSASTTQFGISVLSPTTNQTFINIGVQNSTTGAYIAANASTFASNGNILEFWFVVPIVGWSSNSSMSSDTDTRVVSFTGTQVSQAVTANTTNIAFTASIDRAGAWNGTQYVVPVSGDYVVSGQLNGSAALIGGVYLNGSLYNNGYWGASSTSYFISAGSVLVTGCKAGDLISVRSGTSVTLTASNLGIFRLTGPAVVTAVETVAARYNTSTTTLTNNTQANMIYTTRDYDTHSAYSTSTGNYTVPVSGKYRVTGVITSQAFAAGAAADTFQALVVKNGTTFAQDVNSARVTTSVIQKANVNTSVNCLAGDTLAVQYFHNLGATPVMDTSGNDVYICIERIGN